MPESSWSIIVHGGCKPIAPEDADANRRGCLAALTAGIEQLRRGGSAVDAVEAAVRALEADPTFNAGAGAVRDADGRVALDAAIMDGEDLSLGAVGAATTLPHPISVARAMLAETPTLLAGAGADRFARERGLELCDPEALVAAARTTRRTGGLDTVGCVARDAQGRLAAGTSTGGLSGKRPGRIGDSPLPGCGLYADSRVGAVSLSGDGEMISRLVLGARVLFEMEAGADVETAVERGLARLERTGGEAGAIALDRDGRPGWSHRGAEFAVAWALGPDGAPEVRLSKDEAPHA